MFSEIPGPLSVLHGKNRIIKKGKQINGSQWLSQPAPPPALARSPFSPASRPASFLHHLRPRARDCGRRRVRDVRGHVDGDAGATAMRGRARRRVRRRWSTSARSELRRAFRKQATIWEFFCWVPCRPGLAHDRWAVIRMAAILHRDGRVELVTAMRPRVNIHARRRGQTLVGHGMAVRRPRGCVPAARGIARRRANLRGGRRRGARASVSAGGAALAWCGPALARARRDGRERPWRRARPCLEYGTPASTLMALAPAVGEGVVEVSGRPPCAPRSRRTRIRRLHDRSAQLAACARLAIAHGSEARSTAVPSWPPMARELARHDARPCSAACSACWRRRSTPVRCSWREDEDGPSPASLVCRTRPARARTSFVCGRVMAPPPRCCWWCRSGRGSGRSWYTARAGASSGHGAGGGELRPGVSAGGSGAEGHAAGAGELLRGQAPARRGRLWRTASCSARRNGAGRRWCGRVLTCSFF